MINGFRKHGLVGVDGDADGASTKASGNAAS